MKDEQKVLTRRFNDALAWAAELHFAQTRKASEIPYISHIMAVASLALEYGADEDQAIAALLHDAIEDCGGAPMREAIRARFGDRVTAIVDGCTDAEVTPKPAWEERKVSYMEGMAGKSRDTLLVSACDKLHNARAILGDHRQEGDRVFERFSGKKQGTLWYYRSLVEAYKARRDELPQGLVDELEQTVSALESRAGLKVEPHPARPFAGTM